MRPGKDNKFEVGGVGLVREVLVHSAGVEVPDRGVAHDIHAGRTQEAKVNGRVQLFHKTSLLAARFQPSLLGQGSQELLHDELTSERKHDGVESNKGNVPGSFAILGRRAGVGTRLKR